MNNLLFGASVVLDLAALILTQFDGFLTTIGWTCLVIGIAPAAYYFVKEKWFPVLQNQAPTEAPFNRI